MNIGKIDVNDPETTSASPFPAARINGHEIQAVFHVDGTLQAFQTLGDAIHYAASLPPIGAPPDTPMVA